MRQPIIAGNWKMHGSLSSATELASALRDASLDNSAQLIVFPPFVHISAVAGVLRDSDIAWGAQNVNEHQSGAYTGEVSAEMLVDLGCRYVLVGHSERRQLYDESNQLVADKFKAAQAAGLIPILCVGETLSQREAGETEAVVAEQLLSVVECAGIWRLKDAVLAYEPVWAIGTGETATPEQAEAVHQFLRNEIAKIEQSVADAVQILYGGSVKPGNAKALFDQPNIDGGLVGGASLKAEDFLGIAQMSSRA